MAWLQLHLSLPADLAERAAGILENAGALAVTMQDAADRPVYEPAPQTMPMWAETRITALFEADTETGGLAGQLAHSLGYTPNIEISLLEDQDWISAGRKDFHPMRFGSRLWVCPGWEPPPLPEAVNILLDPGLAFGTGTHPTTAMCLEWLDSLPDLAGMTCIDYGSGSGILAVAALKLGAAEVWAADIDPQALQATRDNALKNGVADKLHTALPGDLPALQADLLAANILANPLCELAPRFARLVRSEGRLALSGILKEQQDNVIAAYTPYFAILVFQERDNWVCLTGKRR